MQIIETKKTCETQVLVISVIRSGFEPETYCLEGSCSIQLSYRTIFFRGANIVLSGKKFQQL